MDSPELGSLSDAQVAVLIAVSTIPQPFVLTGGAALAGFHLGHRTTNDLDLFFDEDPVLDDVVRAVRHACASAGVGSDSIVHNPTFVRLATEVRGDRVIVDLVADPTPRIEAPNVERVGDQLVRVDTAHEILVNKLTALLSRSELRDLIDIRALLEAGGSLPKALDDAPQKDAGFSPVTLCWLLEQYPVEALAAATGADAALARELDAFRVTLIETIAAS